MDEDGWTDLDQKAADRLRAALSQGRDEALKACEEITGGLTAAGKRRRTGDEYLMKIWNHIGGKPADMPPLSNRRQPRA